jgi:hypothetical protein
MNPVMVVRTEVDSDETPICRGAWVWCPACEDAHRFRIPLPDGTATSGQPLWGWNGSETAPTFEGSMLVRGGRQGSDYVCHSFVRSGVWDFLGDCTHALVGKQIPMVPLPDWLC